MRLVYLALLPALVFGQSFELASVKPTEHGRKNGLSQSKVDDHWPGRLVAENSSLDELIRYAYKLKDDQVVGPAWLKDDEESFDIVAQTSSDASKEQKRLMMRTLLKERFQLAAHPESKIVPIYELVVDKNGSKLKAADPAGRRGMWSDGSTIQDTKVTMTDFANHMARELKRPVVDKTGITGVFDLEIQYQRGEDEISRTGGLISAIRSRLGLRLNSAKGPVEVLVVDHIEKAPTEN